MKQWPQAKLLINSIVRVFNSPSIAVLVPYDLSIEHIQYDITLIRFEMESDFRYFPFYDKIVAASICEEQCAYPFVWLDVDSVFLDDFSFDDSIKVQVNPVDKTNIGIPLSKNLSPIWTKVIDYFRLNTSQLSKRYVKTTISHEEIYPYFNIGMVKMEQSSTIFTHTKKAMEYLLSQEDILLMLRNNKTYQVFFHQMIFSCALLSSTKDHEIGKLATYVNYPLHLLKEDDSKVILSNLKTIRYDTYFNNHDVPNELKNIINIDKHKLATYWYYQFI
jgi:hypothetical protein